MPGQDLKRLTEADLKCSYLERSRRFGLIDSDSVIASEYSLGSAGRRVDLAILNGSEFIGVEIKSACDSLKRLRQQLDAYVQCFDRVVLVVDDRHRANAIFLKPDSVELWSAGRDGQISLAKPAKAYPCRSTRALAQLCSVRELRRLAGATSARNSSRSKLIDAVARLSVEEIYEAVTGSFRKSYSASTAAFWQGLGSKEIDGDAMEKLSRFARERQKRSSARKEQAAFWQAWAEEAAATLGSTKPFVVTS